MVDCFHPSAGIATAFMLIRIQGFKTNDASLDGTEPLTSISSLKHPMCQDLPASCQHSALSIIRRRGESGKCPLDLVACQSAVTTTYAFYGALLSIQASNHEESDLAMSTDRIPPPPKWVVELSTPPPSRSKQASSLPDPPGYLSSKAVSKKTDKSTRKPPTQAEMDTLKLKKSWEIALGPAKQLPMQAIMGYMSGNSLQIFSIMMVFML